MPGEPGGALTYSTLIFDLSEVFISGLYGAETELAPRLGLPGNTVQRDLWIPWTLPFFEGRLTEQQYLDEVIRRGGWTGITAEEVGACLRRNFCNRVPGTEELLRRLSGRYELALLSDHAREWVDFIRQQHPFLECFDQRFFSFELRHTKRERITFLTVLYKLGREAGECVFIDDLPSNIEVARSVGLRGIQFKDVKQLSAELRALGIEVE